jgi:L-alanine-DL-glutamate epimerase-like enolase superfamily enzyme
VPPDRGTADRDMKIATIDVIVVGIPFAGGSKSAESAWGKKNASRADSLLVKVTTEGGIIGWGEAFGFTAIPAAKAAIEEVIAPLCIGVSALSIGSLMLDVQKRLHIFGRSGAIMFGISAIDIALWDILGKATGQPVHRLLGGAAVSQLTPAMQVSFATPTRSFSSRTSVELWPMASPM